MNKPLVYFCILLALLALLQLVVGCVQVDVVDITQVKNDITIGGDVIIKVDAKAEIGE